MTTFNQTTRRSIRNLVSRCWPGHSNSCKQIAVVGLPRAGTSWLAKALSLSEGVSYYFEPDYSLDKNYRYRFLSEHDDDPKLAAWLEKTFSGGIRNQYTLAEMGLVDLLRRPLNHTVLTKFVWLPLALNWMGKRFPNVAVVQIVRHPVPQFLSWQQRSWNPGRALGMLLQQDSLMNGPLAPWADTLVSANGFWPQAGAFWGAVTQLQLQAHRPGWVLAEHEWYCEDAGSRLQIVGENLGLRMTEHGKQFAAGTWQGGPGPGYGKARDPRSEIYKWKDKISPDDLADLRRMVELFELPFYADLDPYATLGPDYFDV